MLRPKNNNNLAKKQQSALLSTQTEMLSKSEKLLAFKIIEGFLKNVK